MNETFLASYNFNSNDTVLKSLADLEKAVDQDRNFHLEQFLKPEYLVLLINLVTKFIDLVQACGSKSCFRIAE